ncbi:MAG: flavodoxin domain-containing protein [Methanolinea sp.]|nr:flavodoxin domain-containing protein [Methanolinea sp.]
MSGRDVAKPSGAGGVGKSVLVCYASRYGSTKEIAECIAEEMRCLGIKVECLPAGRDVHPGDYDAVVLGSPLYMGKWLVEARDLVSRERVSLGGVPVAVFSVGYSFRDLSDEHLQSGEAALSDIRLFIALRDAAFFPGRVDPARLSPPDKAIYTIAGVVPGDFRDMEMVRAWARTLPATLGLI